MCSGQLIIAQIAVKPGSYVKGYGLGTSEALKLQIRAYIRVILTKNGHFCLKNGVKWGQNSISRDVFVLETQKSAFRIIL